MSAGHESMNELSDLQQIPLRFRQLRQQIDVLIDKFEGSGHKIYLVGGSVRDLLFDLKIRSSNSSLDGEEAEFEEPGNDDSSSGSLELNSYQEIDGQDRLSRLQVSLPDFDFTTDASPDATEELLASLRVPIWTQGKRFGTIGCIYNNIRCEITTHRSEFYHEDSRKPQVSFSPAIEQDLSRRDFTINSLALKLPELELVDPFGGVTDLINHKLRTPLQATESFSDDPLRMLRAARFIAKGFEPSSEIVEAVSQLKERLSIVSRERIRDELDKLMIEPDPSSGLWFLIETELANQFIPELPALALEQDPVHRHKDVLAHTIAVVAKTRPDKILRLAALFHDIGKPSTRTIGENGASFHFHDVVGAKMTRKRMRELRYSQNDIEDVTTLVELHLRFHTYRLGWTDSAVRRYVRDAGKHLDRLNELTRCDCTTRNQSKARDLSNRMDELELRIAQLKQKEELDAIKPDLTGNDIMDILKLEPGPQVGKALSFMLELRLTEGPLDHDVASKRLLDWWSSERTEST